MISTPSSCVNVVFCCKDWTGQYYFALLFILLTTSILHKGMDFINYFKVVSKNLISPSLNKGPEAPQSYLDCTVVNVPSSEEKAKLSLPVKYYRPCMLQKNPVLKSRGLVIPFI